MTVSLPPSDTGPAVAVSDRADILRRIQLAPGLWTIDQLAAASGLTPNAVADLVADLAADGKIEPPAKPATFADFDTVRGRHDLTFRPTLTPGNWIAPCDRKRPE